jgi:hypothetical protein
MTTYLNLITYLNNHTYVYGDIENIATDHERRYAIRFVAGIIQKIGGFYRASKIINDEDFYTGKPVGLIPPVYRFVFKVKVKVKDAKDKSTETEATYIVSDIRSLVDYTGETLTNPYSTDTVDPEDQARYLKQVRILNQYGWFTSHDLKVNLKAKLKAKSTTTDSDARQLTVNIFSKLSQHHYVDYTWFTDLTMQNLKRLYFLLHELWTERLDLSDDTKRKIAPTLTGDLVLCRNYRSVKLYTDDMEDLLRRELLAILNLLMSGDCCKEGGLYFLLGLVIVSPEAAAAYPSLHTAVTY